MSPGNFPEWARGWVVASVTIPIDGELKDAHVDFQMPDGEPVTLVAGAYGKGGTVLQSIVWEGTPVRARLRLCQGRESADLFAAAALIAKSKVQKKKPLQVEIEGRFFEVPEALTLKDSTGKLLFPPAAKGGKPLPPGGIAGVLTETQLRPLLAQLNKAKGVVLLSAPRVTTRFRQCAVIEIIRECKYPTEWREDDEKKGLWNPTAFEVRNVGVTLEIEPTYSETGTIDLNLIPQVVEHSAGSMSKLASRSSPCPSIRNFRRRALG